MIESATPLQLPDAQNRVFQVASTFTARPLAGSLQPFLVSAGVADAVEFVEYGQVSEYMLGPQSEAANVPGTLVLIRLEDWLRFELKAQLPSTGPELSQKARQALTVHVDAFHKQIGSLAQRGKPVWLLVCPSDGWIAETYRLRPLLRTYANLLLARLRSTPTVMVLNWPSSFPSAELHDRNADRLGQIPYTSDGFAQLGQFLGAEIETGLASRTPNSVNESADGKQDFAKFLGGLAVRVRMSRPEPGDGAHLDRILRTAAAFSLTGEKRDLSDAEVDRLLHSNGCYLISVSDRLSNYGPSGVVAFDHDRDSLLVEALALSCPVLGKQVEYAVISGLAEIVRRKGCSLLVFAYKASGRNQIMLRFLQSLAGPASEIGFCLQAVEADEQIRKVAIAPGAWTLELGK
ncbi:MAG: hypothetical protein JO356_19500 [Acidobacteria bacterium]|nr:hypothetical protein [Acidobacteriota bacterium]